MQDWWAIFPEKLQSVLPSLPWARVTELRLRVGQPLVVCLDGVPQAWPTDNITAAELANLVHKAADYAVYAVVDQIVQGFLTIAGGVRLGLAGELVTERGRVLTMKNYSSVCLRIPHQVTNASEILWPYLFGAERPYATLLIAPPGAGKTTILRDLARQIGRRYPRLQVLILDERGELAACHQGVPQLLVGANCDILTGGQKSYGLVNGLRSLRPDCVVTDEIATAADVAMLTQATRSGVVVLASVHAANLHEVQNKPGLGALYRAGVFARYVVLSADPRPGQVVAVYDAGGVPL